VSALCPGPTETPILDSRGPEDLAAHEGVSARDLLTKAAGEIYPVEDLVADLLAGIDRNKALIVTPRRARLAWWVQRLVPSYLERHASRLVGWAKREAERLERASST
jgi:short-subunit dehydrogenase